MNRARVRFVVFSFVLISSAPFVVSAGILEDLQTQLQLLVPRIATLRSQLSAANAPAAPFNPNARLWTTARPGQNDVVTGEYIVVLKSDGSINDVRRFLDGNNASGAHYSADRTFAQALDGFSASLTNAQVAALKADAAVDYVVPNRIMQMLQSSTTPSSEVVATGVRRMLAVDLPGKGTGINVAVLDTGIDSNHPDLEGKVVGGYDCMEGVSYKDGHGHGTHVAGIISALDNDIGVVGVAPQSRLYAVKVLNQYGYGSYDTVICGLDYVATNGIRNGGPISVANMSLGGFGASDDNCGNTNDDPLHQAICRVRNAGVTVVVAAGNWAWDASYFVPAAYDDAVISVSALADSDGLPGGSGPTTGYGSDDTFATFSNFGGGVDLAAPGVSILSTYLNGEYVAFSGTSMAAPHVAGAAALYLEQNPGSSWTQIRDALVARGEPAGTGNHKAAASHPERVVLATPYSGTTTPADDYDDAVYKYCPKISQTLRRGDSDATKGGQVTELQKFLADNFDLDENSTVTGFFGPTTQRNVQRFQTDHALPAFGIVGSLTRAKIKEVCSAGRPEEPYSQGSYYFQGGYYAQSTYYSESGYYAQSTYYSEASYYAQSGYYSQTTYYAQSGYYAQGGYDDIGGGPGGGK